MPARKKKVIRTEWPRVYLTPKDGKLVWCADSRKTGFAAGGRRFWHTPAEALAYAEQIERTLANEGAAGFAELSITERRDAALALAHLEGAGTLLDAAILFMRERERVERLAAIPTVDEAINAYLNAKRAEETRGEISRQTLYDIESKLRIVREAFGERTLTRIDEAAVRAFIRQLPYAARTRVNIRTKLSQFLNYCRREGKWITVNPTENVKVRVKNAEVKILTIPETRQLLSAALERELPASVIPYLAVQLFAGLRPTEAARLRWERVHFETRQIEVRGETSKTRETRFVDLYPLLAEWLLPFRVKQGPITGDYFVKTLHYVRAAAGLLPWPKDVLRHCFGSYWLAVHRDRAHLAELMGNSLAVIKLHYRRAIPREVAQAFWELTPSPAATPGKIILMDNVLDSMNEFPGLKFKFAKTMPDSPHFYVIRSEKNNTEYEQLFRLIEQQGVWEEWKDGRRYRYLYREGWKYWSMSPDDITRCTVINRAKV
jgi:integrase